jgi:hypothetical protein
MDDGPGLLAHEGSGAVVHALRGRVPSDGAGAVDQRGS